MLDCILHSLVQHDIHNMYTGITCIACIQCSLQEHDHDDEVQQSLTLMYSRTLLSDCRYIEIKI